jgi:hypothetical protein
MSLEICKEVGVESMVEFRAMADTETGTQWFFRYVFVPIVVAVVGGGGLVAILNHGKGQADNKVANTASDTKEATPPASEHENDKSISGPTVPSPVNANHVPVKKPARASGPTSDGQAPDNPISAVCYAEDSTSHERVPKIGQLRKYQDVRIHWNVTNLPADAKLQGTFGDDTGIADKRPIALKAIGNTLYANESGTRTFILEAVQNNQYQVLCMFKLDFIY